MDAPENFALPSDPAGMQRRECPHCHRIFKLQKGELDASAVQRAVARRLPHANDAELAAVPPERFCPYCDHCGPEDDWLTAEQRALVEKRADHWLREVRYLQLMHPLRTLGENPNVTYLAVAPEPFSSQISEKADLFRAFPLLCCRDQVRILRSWEGPVRCHFCGTENVIDPRVPGFEARLADGVDG